jgi:hypothetical protein
MSRLEPNLGWSWITHEEAAGYYNDRITLLLGPSEIPHQILLSANPPSASLLACIGDLPPHKRLMRLPNLTPSVLHCYNRLRPSVPLATAYSWLSMI